MPWCSGYPASRHVFIAEHLPTGLGMGGTAHRAVERGRFSARHRAHHRIPHRRSQSGASGAMLPWPEAASALSPIPFLLASAHSLGSLGRHPVCRVRRPRRIRGREGPVCSGNRIPHLVGIAALGAGGIVGGGSKIVGLPFHQTCHGVGGDVANIRVNGVTAARRAVMNPVAARSTSVLGSRRG